MPTASPASLPRVGPKASARRPAGVAGQQLGGMPQQCGADATVTASPDDARLAGVEAAVLELPRLSHRPAPKADSLRTVGDPVAHDGLVGVAPAATGATPSATVRARGCSLRKSQILICKKTPGQRAADRLYYHRDRLGDQSTRLVPRGIVPKVGHTEFSSSNLGGCG